ncbi:YicC/YloC family endoribonuclease [Vallitalea guaymasensis]|uniref:YicC family protein n=1 Tax=Vallitalea guaymasensis TaxID=1185412 RepID=A0A8J8M6S2_9FIRM|nr:YicC/YloC family endoribonuclease [Vallitalea guaymasensis]QUH27439.1 YicC family protein [Vallitalea guaymasensis]
MVKSMTGFGRGEYVSNDRKMTVEIKSVNHRYCDINVRMPKKISFLENNIRNFVKKKVSRGKVDIFISYEDNSEGNECIKLNEDLIGQYLKYFDIISEKFELDNDIRVSNITRYPEVITIEEQDVDEELLWNLMEKALTIAIEKLISTRTTEGELLKKDIIQKLDTINNLVSNIKTRAPYVIEEYKVKLENRINDLLSSTIDEARLAVEVAIFADKCCVDEEIVRLESHIEHMRRTLDKDIPIGRKLDFLLQEMNRESNTILSKSNDIEVSTNGLELKTEIEKIREQIQNIE